MSQGISFLVLSSWCSCNFISFSFFRFGKFYSIILLKITSAYLLWVSFPSSVSIIYGFCLFIVFYILWMFCDWLFLDLTFFLGLSYTFLLPCLQDLKFSLLLHLICSKVFHWVFSFAIYLSLTFLLEILFFAKFCFHNLNSFHYFMQLFMFS